MIVRQPPKFKYEYDICAGRLLMVRSRVKKIKQIQNILTFLILRLMSVIYK